MEENLKQLEYFYSIDFEIKKIMAECAPKEIDESSEETRIKYFDKLYKALESIDSKLSIFLQGPFFNKPEFLDNKYKKSRAYEYFKEKTELLKSKLIECETLKLPLNNAYNDCFASMSDNLIHDVKENIYGDSFAIQGKADNLIIQAYTINEILHVLHAYVENNVKVLSSLPMLDRKKYPERKPPTKGSILVGNSSNILAREIFKEFELGKDSRYAYICALKDRTIMMIRDVGHALSMQITEENEESVRVEYFIPAIKGLKDLEIISKLPVMQQSISEGKRVKNAIGLFYTTKNSAATDVCSFIDLIPGDFGLNPDVSKVLSIRDEDEAYELIENGEIKPETLLRHLKHISIDFSEKFKDNLISIIEKRKLEMSETDLDIPTPHDLIDASEHEVEFSRQAEMDNSRDENNNTIESQDDENR